MYNVRIIQYTIERLTRETNIYIENKRMDRGYSGEGEMEWKGEAGIFQAEGISLFISTAVYPLRFLGSSVLEQRIVQFDNYRNKD